MVPVESMRAPNLAVKIKIPQITPVAAGFEPQTAVWHGFDCERVLSLEGGTL